MAKQQGATIEQILGEVCINKRRFMETDKPAYIGCVECTGYYSFSRVIGCDNYGVPTKKKDIMRRMKNMIRRYNDMRGMQA